MRCQFTVAIIAAIAIITHSSGVIAIAQTESPRRGGRGQLTDEDRQFIQTQPREIRSILESKRLDQVSCSLNCEEHRSTPLSDLDVLGHLFFEHPELISNPLKECFPDSVKKVDLEVLSGVVDSSKKKPLPDPLPPGEVPVWVNMSRLPPNNELRWEISTNNVPIPSNIPLPDAAALIRKLKRQIETNVAKALPDFSRDYIKKYLVRVQESVTKELEQQRNEADVLRQKIGHLTGIPTDKVADELAEISRQEVAAELSLVGMDARESAIHDQMAKIASQMDQKNNNDETLENLQRLLKLRIERFDNLKKQQAAGVITVEELQGAESEMLAAKIDLEKTRNSVKHANGGDQLDALTAELSRLAIDRAETQARRDYLKKKDDSVEHSLQERREAERQLQLDQPKLTAAEDKIKDLTAATRSSEGLARQHPTFASDTPRANARRSPGASADQ